VQPDPSRPVLKRSRVTEEQVYVIRAYARVLGMRNSDIGRKMGFPRETIRDIVNRKSWANLPPSDPESVELALKRLQQWSRCQECGQKLAADHIWGPFGPVDMACIPCVNDERACPKAQDPTGTPWAACVCYRTGVRPHGQDAGQGEAVLVPELLQSTGT
jgi:hypothetical protein